MISIIKNANGTITMSSKDIDLISQKGKEIIRGICVDPVCFLLHLTPAAQRLILSRQYSTESMRKALGVSMAKTVLLRQTSLAAVRMKLDMLEENIESVRKNKINVSPFELIGMALYYEFTAGALENSMPMNIIRYPWKKLLNIVSIKNLIATVKKYRIDFTNNTQWKNITEQIIEVDLTLHNSAVIWEKESSKFKLLRDRFIGNYSWDTDGSLKGKPKAGIWIDRVNLYKRKN